MTKPRTIAVASRSFSRHPILRRELLEAFPSVTFNDDGLSLKGPALVDFLQGHEAVITALEKIDDTVLAALPDLRIVSKYGVGLDMLDLHAFNRRGIRLGWTGGVNKRSVSELVISSAIALFRHVPAANAEVHQGLWRQVMGRHLSGRTVGIIGLGHIGKDLSVLLKAFGCRVLAHDIKAFPDFCAAHDVEAVDIDTLLRLSDVVTLHLPLDGSTRNILSSERLALMRPDAILINAARGGLVDEAAVKRMLMEGRLAGAAFDVLEIEPPTDLDFLRLPNVLATPHIGGSAEEAVLAMGRAAISGLLTAKVPEPHSEVWLAAGAG